MDLSRKFGLLALCSVGASCGSKTASVPSSLVGPGDTQSGKLVELVLFDVIADGPLVDSLAGLRTFDSASLPAEYTMLAAMPDSGPLEATYSVVFDVNRTRVSVANIEPYYLTASQPGVAAPWNAGPGKFEIAATAYADKDGEGDVVGARTITIEIVQAAGK